MYYSEGRELQHRHMARKFHLINDFNCVYTLLIDLEPN